MKFKVSTTVTTYKEVMKITYALAGVVNKKNKSITTTATGCVITSDIKLLELDVTGNFLEDQINFNAYSVVTK